jgi:glutaredoxin 2
LATAYRHKYPEASTKASHYQNVVSNLRNRRSNLQRNLIDAKSRRPADYENTKLSGEYYTKYVDKKDDWIDQLDRIIAKYDRFLLQVDNCIQNADNLAKKWSGRINIMEAYDDGT